MSTIVDNRNTLGLPASLSNPFAGSQHVMTFAAAFVYEETAIRIDSRQECRFIVGTLRVLWRSGLLKLLPSPSESFKAFLFGCQSLAIRHWPIMR